jgi:hypothetical protein
MVTIGADVALAQSLVTFPLMGTITKVDELTCMRPDAFARVMVGDTWWLSYTFDPTTNDVDGRSTVGQYRETITDMTLTIGSASISGAPGLSLPSTGSSVIAVNLNADYADYVVQVGFPDATAWATVILSDVIGTPFGNDSLPLELPTAFDVAFPDLRAFSLRLAASTDICVAGNVSDEQVGLPLIDLIAAVQALQDAGAIKKSQADSLSKKLTAVMDKLGQGKEIPACNKLQAFIDDITKLVNGGKLDAEDGQDLSDRASVIQGQLGCPE